MPNRKSAITGVDDNIIDGTITSTITVVDDANSDDDFDAIADQTVSVDTTDDDGRSFTIVELLDELQRLTESRNHGHTFTVALDAEPAIRCCTDCRTSDDTGEATVNKSTRSLHTL